MLKSCWVITSPDKSGYAAFLLAAGRATQPKLLAASPGSAFAPRCSPWPGRDLLRVFLHISVPQRALPQHVGCSLLGKCLSAPACLNHHPFPVLSPVPKHGNPHPNVAVSCSNVLVGTRVDGNGNACVYIPARVSK